MRMHLISKLRRDAALYLPPTPPYQGRGRPVVYGAKVNPKEIDSKYRVSTQTQGNITTEVYQIECRLQIEFNFRDAKQFWGLDDFINVKQMPIENAANLSMFRVNVSVSKLREKFGAEHPSLGTVFVEREPRVHTVYKLKHGDLTQEC